MGLKRKGLEKDIRVAEHEVKGSRQGTEFADDASSRHDLLPALRYHHSRGAVLVVHSRHNIILPLVGDFIVEKGALSHDHADATFARGRNL